MSMALVNNPLVSSALVNNPLVGSAAFDPSPSYLVGSAWAPPGSEVGARPGQTVPWAKWYGIRTNPCKTFVGASFCGIEQDMWTMVRALINPSHTVLELGARYGTTSCVLAEATNNSGKVVSVEPDPQVHAALRDNRQTHSCNFAILRGTAGVRPQVLAATYAGSTDKKQYEVRTRDAEPSDAAASHLPRLDFVALERLTGLGFTALVVDCEGCLAGVLTDALLRREHPRLELLLLEQDVHKRVNYAEW